MSSPAVVWHDLECGSYTPDLPLWRELAGRASIDGGTANVLELGAGSGRVALDLARAGHRVTALDLDVELLEALRDRAGALRIETVCADARTFDLGRDDVDLCLMPMQTVQLLGGTAGRLEFLTRAHAHLRPGGLLAVAFVTAVEPFDCAGGDVGPSPETAQVDGVRYATRAVGVRARGQSFLIERERRIGREGEPERDVIELDRLGASALEREAIGAGLSPEPARELEPTQDHVGSTVVILRA